MKQIVSMEQLEIFTAQNGITVLEAASRTCAPCISIRQKIKVWAKAYPDIATAFLELEDVPEAAGWLQVFAAPAVLVYIDGKLCIRQAGCFSLDTIFCQIERYRSMM